MLTIKLLNYLLTPFNKTSISATSGEGGYRGLQGLEGDPYTRVHQVLLLLHREPRGLPRKPRQTDPRGDGAVRLQVGCTLHRFVHQWISIFALNT